MHLALDTVGILLRSARHLSRLPPARHPTHRSRRLHRVAVRRDRRHPGHIPKPPAAKTKPTVTKTIGASDRCARHSRRPIGNSAQASSSSLAAMVPPCTRPDFYFARPHGRGLEDSSPRASPCTTSKTRDRPTPPLARRTKQFRSNYLDYPHNRHRPPTNRPPAARHSATCAPLRELLLQLTIQTKPRTTNPH